MLNSGWRGAFILFLAAGHSHSSHGGCVLSGSNPPPPPHVSRPPTPTAVWHLDPQHKQKSRPQQTDRVYHWRFDLQQTVYTNDP